jgi:hypothetical protein
MHAEKSAQHGDGVVAPESAVTPNNILWHPHNPAWHAGITRINESPPSPNFFSGRWPDLIGVIAAIAAETVFVAIVTFTGVKDLVLHVLPDIGFECPVLLRS